MIRPTNGRVVLFTPNKANIDAGMVQLDVKQPLTAHVVHIWGDRLINVTVLDSYGIPHSCSSVPLLQDDDRKPEGGFFCTWMDYQKGHAAKAEAAEAALLKAKGEAAQAELAKDGRRYDAAVDEVKTVVA